MKHSNRFIFPQTMSSVVYFSFMSYEDSPIKRLTQGQLLSVCFFVFFSMCRFFLNKDSEVKIAIPNGLNTFQI